MVCVSTLNFLNNSFPSLIRPIKILFMSQFLLRVREKALWGTRRGKTHISFLLSFRLGTQISSMRHKREDKKNHKDKNEIETNAVRMIDHNKTVVVHTCSREEEDKWMSMRGGGPRDRLGLDQVF